MTNTEAVLERHLTAFGQQNLSGIMDTYTDESVVVTNLGTFSGTDGIERLFDDLFADFSRGESTIEIRQRIVKEPFAYVIWRGITPENVYEFAADTFYIPEDDIRFQTVAVEIAPNN